MENSEKTPNQIILLNTEEIINSCVFSNNNHQIAAGGRSGQVLIYAIEKLAMGIAIVTPISNIDNSLSLRCSYCAKSFEIFNEDFGNFVKCPFCMEKLQVNDFIINPVILKNKKKKKGFFSKLFRR